MPVIEVAGRYAPSNRAAGLRRPLNVVLGAMAITFRIVGLLIILLTSDLIQANPEYAAKHGIKGLWTVREKAQLPQGCKKVGEGALEAPVSSIRKGKGEANRTYQSLEIARQLDAGYALANKDTTFVEYFKCPKLN